MSGFSFTGTPPGVPDKPLKEVASKLVNDTSVAYDGDMTLHGLKFSLNTEAVGRVEAFNDKDDTDEERVFGVPSKDDSGFKAELEPLLRPDGERAWTKYRFKAGGKVSVSGEFSNLGVSLDAAKGFIFADYHVHPIDMNALVAVVSDLTQLRLATRTEDVLALEAGDAVTFQTYATLAAGVSLSWSDVFTAGLASLSGLAAAGKTLSIKVNASASVEFKVSLSDDFRIVFTKAEGGGVRVSVLKSKSREANFKASLGVEAEFANPADAEQYLSKMIEAVAGEPVAKIDELFNAATPETLIKQLPEATRPFAEALAAQFGGTELFTTVGELKDKWEGLKKKVDENVKKAAQTKVKAGFTYEYLRVSQEDTLLDVDLPVEQFREFHGRLVAGYLTDATDWAREHKDALHNYLHRKSVTRTHTWGFSLSITPWGLTLKGQDKLEKALVVQENIDDFQRVAFNGMRSYEGAWPGSTDNWAVDFKAQTPNFSHNKIPTTCDFEYGLSFNWGWEEKALSRDELLGCLDHAVIWRVVSADDVGGIVERLADRIGRRAKLSLELTFDNDTLRALLPAVAVGEEASPDHEKMTKNDVLATLALGAAMPLWEPYEARRSPFVRKTLYAPLWEAYFRDDELPARDYAKTAAKLLPAVAGNNHINIEGLAGREGALVAQPDIHTFAGQIFYNGDAEHMQSVHRKWLRFVEGLKMLNAAVTPVGCVPYTTGTISDIFDRLQGFWSQVLYLRAAGVYLLGLASGKRDEDGNLLIKSVKRTLNVTFTDDDLADDEKTVIFTSAA
ncbi:MAG: hypothetical protein QOJ76_2153 [Acidobacteriota bacterium]|nr:hypothetical protein [Acidobacteriota bacterium]